MTTEVKNESAEVADQPEPEKSFFARGVLLGLIGGALAAVLLISIGGSVISLFDDVFGSGEEDAAAVTDGTDGDSELVSQGKNLTAPCIGCHSTNGVDGVGPSWQGLAGSERTLEGGETVVADAEYIRSSIVNPNDQIVMGFAADQMPGNYGDTFSAEELDALVAYLLSLQQQVPPQVEPFDADERVQFHVADAAGVGVSHRLEEAVIRWSVVRQQNLVANVAEACHTFV